MVELLLQVKSTLLVVSTLVIFFLELTQLAIVMITIEFSGVAFTLSTPFQTLLPLELDSELFRRWIIFGILEKETIHLLLLLEATPLETLFSNLK